MKITIMPEEKFNQDVWWILQEIKKEQLATPKGEKVYFSLRLLPKTSSIRRKDVDYGFPQADTQRKLLYKLKEWKALDLQPTGMYFDDLFNPPTAYLLTILEKFDEFYRLYESGGSYSENQKTITELDSSQSIIKPKSLELIAKEIGDLDSGSNLVEFLTDCGVKRELIEYPNTKWRMIYDVLSKLTTSGNAKDKEILFNIIINAMHPLTHRGDTESAEILQEKFSNYLKYDNLEIFYTEGGIPCKIAPPLSQQEMNEIMTEFKKEEEKQLKYLCRPENRDKISLLRKASQALMNVVEIFCENPSKPTPELNNAYQFLNELVRSIMFDLHLLKENYIFNRNNYTSPFFNLFAAEKQYREQGKELSWQKIRPEMNAMYGEIDELYRKVKGSDILTEPNKQRQLNDIQLYLSELKEKAKEIREREKIQTMPTAKIEITSMPELQIKGLEEKVILQKPKNKRIQLRKFPADTKWNDIIIQFLNDHEVIVRVKDETHQTTYEAMGFQDEKKKLPNKQWQFLKLLAFKNGEISWENNRDLSLQQINSIKKQKQLLTEALKAYFQIYDDEPFYDYKKEKAYKIKLNLTPESNAKTTPNEQEIFKEDDELGIKEAYKEQTPEISEE